MRKLLLYSLLLLSLFDAKAQDVKPSITLSAFTESNSQCISYDVIYEGCSLLLCSDGEYMFVQFNILHPEMQMRFLMQGVTFYVDPTGRKKEKYSIEFPSAHDVKEILQASEPNQNISDTTNINTEIRPDILPLIEALNATMVVFNIGNKRVLIPNEMSSIHLNITEECLSYSVLFPIDKMLTEKKLANVWTLGLYSDSGSPSRNNPGSMGGPGMGGITGPIIDQQSMPNRPQMQGHIKGDNDIRRVMMKKIETWIQFDFSESCSLN